MVDHNTGNENKVSPKVLLPMHIAQSNAGWKNDPVTSVEVTDFSH
jgi:hypothetical protein